MLKTYAFVATACMAVAPALAQVDEAAKQKLQQMADAIQNANSLSYKVEFSGAGGFFSMLPAVRSTVTLKKQPDKPGVWLSRVEGRRDAVGDPEKGGAAAIDILLVGDGNTKTWLDAPNKKVIEKSESQAGNADVILAAGMGNLREITESGAMTKELGAPGIKPDASETVAGETCDVVTADQGPQQYSTRWSISQKDRFPRKVTRAYPGIGTQTWTITEVKINPDVPETAFKIPTPDGYTFEPAVRPTAASPNPPPAMVPTGPTTATAPSGPKERAVGGGVDDLAPDFELTNLKGEKVKLSDLRGNVVVLAYWGTWCLPCKKVAPELQRLADTYKEKPVKVFALTMREPSEDRPAEYMKDNSLTFGVLTKADETAKAYKVKAPPSYFVVGKEGQIAYVASGYEEGKTFPAIVQAIERAFSGQPITTNDPGKASPTGQPAGDSDK
jgi:peroxiredoxin/outer membrane lipoprotein-sorting protein